MSEPIPSGAFPECEQFEQKIATMDLGGPKKAFTSRKDALVAMRNLGNAHDAELKDLDERLASVEGVIRDRPF